MHYRLTHTNGGDGLCAIHVITDNNGGQVYYVYKDHLGSILTLTNSDATEQWNQSFGAWGGYRDADTWETTEGPGPGWPVWLSRGYTSHEHLPQFDLINMNARMGVYPAKCGDPPLGGCCLLTTTCKMVRAHKGITGMPMC